MNAGESVVMVKATDEQARLGEVVERLAGSYPTLSPDTVAEVVHDLHARFDGAPGGDTLSPMTDVEDRTAHWDERYRTVGADRVSWFEPEPHQSLAGT